MLYFLLKTEIEKNILILPSRTIDWKSIFLAFLHLFHCLSSINECPSSEFIHRHLLNLSNVVQISDEICQNVEHYINDLEKCYNNLTHGIIDTHVVKDCFLKVLVLIRTMANTDGEKGLNYIYITVFCGLQLQLRIIW